MVLPNVQHVRSWENDSVVVWTMDYEAVMHDTIVALEKGIREHYSFKIED